MNIGCVRTALPMPRSRGLHPPARIQAPQLLRLERWLCYSDTAPKAARASVLGGARSCSTLTKIRFVSGRYLFVCLSRCTELLTICSLVGLVVEIV
jgi:hypothetical protein